MDSRRPVVLSIINSRNLTLITRIVLSLITFTVFFEASTLAQDPSCPAALLKLIPDGNVCDKIKCKVNVTEEMCPRGTFFTEKLTFCGCCPGCAKYVGIKGYPLPGPDEPTEDNFICTPPGEPSTKKWTDCEEEGPSCPFESSECMPQLICNAETKECSLPTGVLDRLTQECMYKKSLFRLGLFHWDPQCNPDGSYAPKQCKGEYGVDGICFCVDTEGRRIFGREWRALAENQTCACSRQTSLLRTSGQLSTLHCSYDGNYEPLQCDTDSGVCYCVDEQTGKLSGGTVPQGEWKNLPCFSENITNFMDNGRYLRMCESYHAGVQSLLKEGAAHQTTIKMATPACDFDGSYAPVQSVGSTTKCVFKNGTTIRDYFTSVNGDAITCRCARDEWLYKVEGLPFSYQCGGDSLAGSYKSYYNFGTVASCVDTDGVLYGDKVESKYACCLDRSCSPAQCYNSETNPTGYRACCDWPFGGVCTTTEGTSNRISPNNTSNKVD